MILLLGILLLILLIYYIVSNQYTSPFAIVVVSFILALIGSLIGDHIWGITVNGDQSVSIIIIGLLSFSIGSLVVTLINGKYRIAPISSSELNCPSYILNNRATLIALTIIIGTIYIYFSDIRRLVSSIGYSGNILEIISIYRNYIIQSQQGAVFDTTSQISALSGFLFRCVEVIATFVVINYVFLDSDRRKRYASQYIAIILASVAAFFLCGGSRSPIIHYVIAGIVAIGIKYTREHAVIPLAQIVKFVLALILILSVFVGLSTIRGEELRLSIFGYITFFFGSGISSLNYVLSTANEYAPSFLSSLYDLLDRLGITTPQISNNIWIQFDGYSSNVFTGFFPYYTQGGLLAVAVYGLCLGIVFTLLYMRASKSDNVIWTVTYCLFAYALFDLIRADALNALIGIPLFEYLIILITIQYIIKTTKFRNYLFMHE